MNEVRTRKREGRRGWLAPVLLAAVLVLAGCGADGDDASAAAPPDPSEVEADDGSEVDGAEVDGAEVDGSDADDGGGAAEEPEPAEPTGEPVGQMTIGDETIELFWSGWCGPDDEPSGSLSVLERAFAHDGDEVWTFHAYTLEHTRNGSLRQGVEISRNTDEIEDMDRYRADHLTDELDGYPFLVIDGDTATFAAEQQVRGDGEAHDVEAEFTLPAEPGGVPLWC